MCKHKSNTTHWCWLIVSGALEFVSILQFSSFLAGEDAADNGNHQQQSTLLLPLQRMHTPPIYVTRHTSFTPQR